MIFSPRRSGQSSRETVAPGVSDPNANLLHGCCVRQTESISFAQLHGEAADFEFADDSHAILFRERLSRLPILLFRRDM